MMDALTDVPDIEQFIKSVDTSSVNRLLGIFFCPPESYGDTSRILNMAGYPGYQVLKGEIEGKSAVQGRDPKRGWTCPVKSEGAADSDFRIFIGLVRHPDTEKETRDTVSGWFGIVSFLHELAHARDLNEGVTFRLGQPFKIRDAEYFAHDYVCKFLRERRMTCALTAYLSIAVISIAEIREENAIIEAARLFMKSEEYRQSFQSIPRIYRKTFNIREPR